MQRDLKKNTIVGTTSPLGSLELPILSCRLLLTNRLLTYHTNKVSYFMHLNVDHPIWHIYFLIPKTWDNFLAWDNVARSFTYYEIT